MGIDVEPKQIKEVVQLVANPTGWQINQTRYSFNPDLFVTGNPDVKSQTPDHLRESLQRAWLETKKQRVLLAIKERRPPDFNGLKVAVNRLAVRDDILVTEGYLTDYFTLWGIPRAATEQFQKHSEEIIINKAQAPEALYETSLPWGVCTHNILLDENGDILMLTRSLGQGFNAGRVSVTEEEQMDPDRDMTPFNAAYTSYWEEMGVLVPPSTVRLLGVAMEKGVAYPAYCFVANTRRVAKNIVETWRKARDYKENTALFAVPMTEIDPWLRSDEVKSDVWHKHLLSGNVAPDAILKLHVTSPWRIELLKSYTG